MTKLSSKHQKTLKKVFEVPTLASIEWRNIESMLKAFGAHLEEGNGSRVHFLLAVKLQLFTGHTHKKKQIKVQLFLCESF